MADDIKKKRGRPPLPPDQRKPIVYVAGKSSTKAGGYAAQKRYAANHKGEVYEFKVRIKTEYKTTLTELMANTGLSLTQLCVTALEEKYNVTLHKNIDNQ